MKLSPMFYCRFDNIINTDDDLKIVKIICLRF
jgi:hypothetical protein